MNLTEKTGPLTCQLLVHDEEDLLLITTDGTIIRTPVSSISILSRNTQGVRLMRVEEDCRVVCVARAEAEEETEEAAVEPVEAGSGSDLDYDAPALDDAPTEKTSDEPDALDRLLDDLEDNPEPTDDI